MPVQPFFRCASFAGSTRLLFDGVRRLGDFFKCSKCSFRIPAISEMQILCLQKLLNL